MIAYIYFLKRDFHIFDGKRLTCRLMLEEKKDPKMGLPELVLCHGIILQQLPCRVAWIWAYFNSESSKCLH